MANRNEYMRMYYRKRREQGLCRICGEKAVNGRTLCPFCAKHTNTLRKMRKAV